MCSNTIFHTVLSVSGLVRLVPQVPLPHLCAIWADLVERPSRAVQEADDLMEVVIANTPGAIHQEDEIGLGSFTNCDEGKESVCGRERAIERNG